jgi:glycosyltransferase involved in cell wall biosynthesis
MKIKELPNSPGAQAASHGLSERDIVCFSNDWTGDPLSKTHLMRLLARQNRILWVNSIGYRAPRVCKADIGRLLKKLVAAAKPVHEAEPNIFLLNPLAIPAYGNLQIRALNRRWLRFQVMRAMRSLGFQRPINWVFNPTAGVVAGALGEDRLIYHCVDEFSAFTGVASNAIADLEEQLLRKADLVIVSSELLYLAKVQKNPRTVLVRHGVDYSHFRRALEAQTPIPPEIAQLPRPVIGFFGLIADWVDTELMVRVAQRFPAASLVILGKATTDVLSLEGLPNVYLLGRKPYHDLPGYCKGFDVALMPFRINQLTLNSNPLKVREYLAAGLPVVSTPIPEVEVLGLCRIAASPENFLREVEAALANPGPSWQRSDAIRHESWEARLNEICCHLAALDGKRVCKTNGTALVTAKAN